MLSLCDDCPPIWTVNCHWHAAKEKIAADWTNVLQKSREDRHRYYSTYLFIDLQTNRHSADDVFAITELSVCLSVCLSVTLMHLTDRFEFRGIFFLHHIIGQGPGHLRVKNLPVQSSKGNTPAGALNTGGVWKFRDFRPISRYISETRQDRLIVAMEHRTSIESLMCSIEPRHFRWPWVTPNLDFKVTVLFDGEYLENGAIFL